MSDRVSHVRAVGHALTARPFFWIADHLAAARAPALWRAHRALRRDARALRWNDYESAHAARAAHLDIAAVTYGETPLAEGVRLLAWAGVGQGDRVLDLGAGIGTLLLAARARGAEARGVELVSSRARCGARAAQLAGATLEEGDARVAVLDAPQPPTHVVLTWTTWPAALRDAVVARVRALDPVPVVIAFTHEPAPADACACTKVRTLAGGLDAWVWRPRVGAR